MIAINDQIDMLFEAHADGRQDVSAIVFCDPFRMKLFVDHYRIGSKKCESIGIASIRITCSLDGCYYTSCALLFKSGAICFVYCDFNLFDEYYFSSAKIILRSEYRFNTERILQIADNLHINDLLPSWLSGKYEMSEELSEWLGSIKISD